MSRDQPTGRHRLQGLIFNIAVTALDVGLAIAAFHIARRAGASEAEAYVIGSIGPLLGGLAVWLRAREVSGASLAVLAFTVLSAAAVLVGSHDARVLLYKDAVVVGLIGLIFAGSMLFPRPLAFYFGQRFATDGSREGVSVWNDLWSHPLFRRANYVVTAVWAVTYLLEALGRVYLIQRSDFDAAYTSTQILPFAAAAVAIVLTIVIAKYYESAAEPLPRLSTSLSDDSAATRHPSR